MHSSAGRRWCHADGANRSIGAGQKDQERLHWAHRMKSNSILPDICTSPSATITSFER